MLVHNEQFIIQYEHKKGLKYSLPIITIITTTQITTSLAHVASSGVCSLFYFIIYDIHAVKDVHYPQFRKVNVTDNHVI
jgi:hypothetical protein